MVAVRRRLGAVVSLDEERISVEHLYPKKLVSGCVASGLPGGIAPSTTGSPLEANEVRQSKSQEHENMYILKMA